jgi:hypothetical protein
MFMKVRLFIAVMVLVLATIITFTGGVFSQEYTGLIISENRDTSYFLR